MRRDIPEETNTEVNDLTRRVLLSIEAAMVGPQDNANCLRRRLCEDNRYSRDLQDKQKLWIPIWRSVDVAISFKAYFLRHLQLF